MTTEPKIVVELDCGEVAAYAIRSGVGITFLAPAAHSVRYTATFDRPNAKALRDALTVVLDKGEG